MRCPVLTVEAGPGTDRAPEPTHSRASSIDSKDLPADKKIQTLNPDKKNELYTGFVAQEVEQAAKELGFDFSGVDKPKDATKQTYALRYSDFVVPLVKAVQEQQKMIEELKKEIEELKKK